jgi:CxxC motif-containing protein (DUF1111 family)
MNQKLVLACAGLAALSLVACDDGGEDTPPAPDAGIAEGIFAKPGEIRPSATDAQRAIFARGEAVAKKRFGPADGLGPKFNVTFCAACHEKPVFGGAAGRYRDFFIHGQRTGEGTFFLSGDRAGILAAYDVDPDAPRPMPDPDANVFALRNPIPFFGVGLIAELPEEVILANADPDDADGDGISGRPNYDRGFVGRFGMKAQTVSIEGFIRGPLFNHVGLTSDPLTAELQDRLPVPSAAVDRVDALTVADGITQRGFHQAAAPAEPLTDDDAVADPELAPQDLFDLVAWSMLLAAPQPEPPTEESERGRGVFAEVGCAKCHVPSLVGPRGAIPLYSDLLLHDMGEETADGLTMGLAEPSEFRTAPLWGIDAVGPYLHDGRADTLDEAIRLHGGEGAAARDAYVALADDRRADLLAFLDSLGTDDVVTEGLVPPGAPIPPVGAAGGPQFELVGDEVDLFLAGRSVFDRDRPTHEGTGPRFNGDSCRACHFDPVVGGAGPLDVNAMRNGTLGTDGGFTAPPEGTGLAKLAIAGAERAHGVGRNVFEARQTPTALGLGALDRVPPESILANADPTDADGDGIAGIAHILPDDDRIGRFGWKAQVPNASEFVRDALTNEIGLTLPPQPGHTFGLTEDDDDVPDPEITLAEMEALHFYLTSLAPPPPPAEDDPAARALFEQVGCADCHVPRLDGLDSEADAFTDLLLHVVGPTDKPGIVDGLATMAHFRTPPLWGLGTTAPYMHDGSAATVEAAIRAHEGEALASREAFEALDDAARAQLLGFLESL